MTASRPLQLAPRAPSPWARRCRWHTPPRSRGRASIARFRRAPATATRRCRLPPPPMRSGRWRCPFFLQNKSDPRRCERRSLARSRWRDAKLKSPTHAVDESAAPGAEHSVLNRFAEDQPCWRCVPPGGWPTCRAVARPVAQQGPIAPHDERDHQGAQQQHPVLCDAEQERCRAADEATRRTESPAASAAPAALPAAAGRA